MLCRCLPAFRLGLLVLAVCGCGLAQQPSATAPAQKSDPAAGQATGQATTLSLDARLVNLPVIVRDKKGAPIQNLTKDDFTLTVDGHAETIRYFDKDNDLPLTIGLLVDVSGSVRNMLDDERAASSAFLDQMLKAPADRAFIIQFSNQTELLQDVTGSRPKLQAALRELGSPSPNPPSGQTNDPDDNNDNNRSGPPRRRVGGTTLYDAAFLSADEVLSKQKGRKAIVILTDGDDRGSRETLNRAIEAAQRADTIIYAVYFKGDDHSNYQQDDRRGYPGGGGRYPGGGGYPGGGYPGGGYPGGGYPGGGYPGGGGRYPQQRPQQETRLDGKKILERMTAETGGRMFEQSKKQDFAAIYSQIADELRQQYRLGFTPDQAILEDGYHRIDLRLLQKKDLKIQTRDGYYTGK